ncbi:hypothetical protein [Gilliamella intestini]|uniref:Uncharacterized protein n=1 Tax=Gilliamella intestini TaxID=1798183 RepID=A0A1C4BXU9_9GAMM|nr:hypothetical protein [Gilliamella intestini]SCC11630.1 hypothetical protein GA0061080_102634 [Gilliamella intestini]
MKAEIIAILSKQFDKTTVSDKRFFMSALIAKLNLNGYVVEKEAKHPFLENAKINLKVSKSGKSCWIELDNKSPRIRSLERIQSLGEHGEQGFILLRNGFLSQHKTLGIDVVSARR